MKEWIIKAGLVSVDNKDQCQIVYEPDCASLGIRHEIYNRCKNNGFEYNPTDDGEEEKDEILFGEGHKYILIDAGGGTVDCACHEITGKFGVREIFYPTGGTYEYILFL